MQSYVTNRQQRTKVNNRYNNWEEVLFEVPQGSILGHLLFNIHMCDVFFMVEENDIASYADGNTLYSGMKLLKK